MQQPVLNDRDQFPTDEVIFAHIGKAKAAWQGLFEHLRRTHPAFSAEWRYYDDGKSWLLKIVGRKKTICWVSVVEKSFRMTFYFTDKAERSIADSDIRASLKRQFRDGKRFGKLRALTIDFRSEKDLPAARTLLAIKDGLK